MQKMVFQVLEISNCFRGHCLDMPRYFLCLSCWDCLPLFSHLDTATDE